MAPISATLRVSLLGFGSVARELVRRLAERQASSPRILVVAVCDRSGGRVDPDGLDLRGLLDLKATRGSVGGDPALTPLRIAAEVDADVVVDLLPTDLRTGENARAVALAAFRARRHVVTAGKGGLALHAQEILGAAEAAGRRYVASGSVLGGTPILELLSSAFHGDRLERFDAVLNGSTNFLLTLLEQGETWDAALAQARGKGILEADPSLDLLGFDAAAKAVILANHAWGTRLTLADVKTQGILGITAEEVREARAKGMAIRLVAHGSPSRGVAVAPVTLPRDHALVTEGTENAIRLSFAGAGTVSLRGPGAGGRETAHAVLSDLVSLAPARKELLVAATRAGS